MVIPGSWGCEEQVFGMLLGRQVCRFYDLQCSCSSLHLAVALGLPEPPTWYLCAGSELCWEPASSAAERREPGVLLGPARDLSQAPWVCWGPGGRRGLHLAGSSPGSPRFAQVHPWRLVSVPRRHVHTTQLRAGDQE